MPIYHKYYTPYHTYKVVRSDADERDYSFDSIYKPINPLPAYVDLTDKCPPVYDQGQLGSCFPGETIIPLLNGKKVSIQELAEGVEGREFWVYSNKNGRIVPGKATASKTGINRSLVNVTLDNGQSIKCTPDHKFLMNSGKYVEARKLMINGVLAANGEVEIKVASVTELHTKQDVYCLTVPEFENFALEAGVFVHNCTGNAIAAAYEFDQMKQNITSFAPSRLFIYYNERLMEGDIGEDNGAQIRDGIKSIANYGVCSESLWPYDITKFTETPPTFAYHEAKKSRALKYYSVKIERAAIKQALAQGYPVVTGISVFASFESSQVAATGTVPMPEPQEQDLGGHCVLIVGYSDKKQQFIVRNSWGVDWGNKGYFTLPYGYCTPDLMTDLWVITTVT